MNPAYFFLAILGCPLWDVGDTLPAPKQLEVAAAAAGIEGYYAVAGIEADGNDYTGIAQIMRRGEVYVVGWLAGGMVEGVGIRIGDTFSVAWSQQKKGKTITGINVYRIDGRKLTGRWATRPGDGKLKSETLTWIKGVE